MTNWWISPAWRPFFRNESDESIDLVEESCKIGMLLEEQYEHERKRMSEAKLANRKPELNTL